ncbi:uncharacterized protein TRAVEDRAFT_149101 [Trametes versicolor FP-101664 SS1]|uniref:uncharacterized protein n=1 Tax=Trametes versicolor (strain FP-101664) TaxID=717944 RepID=UPI0004623422|nr:uncharacterized protein TRAVEDRAFT_149101 [Trametes versicolor FP-101664 SS1]EIW58736.1 hypothetical protein TRAVEDRAFT_149101 [Trametes versicolor FP-101664 SS1]
MDASSNELRTSILDWDENDVHNWLSKLGFPQYEQQVKEHNISGDVLCLLDPESLKEMGISTIGQRLTILKAVYNVKLAQNIPIEPEHYVPPSEAEERQEVSVGRLYDLLKDQSERLRSLEDDNRRLSDTLSSCLEDLGQLRGISARPQLVESESPVQRSHSFKWGSFVKPAKSPTKASTTDVESPQPSPQRMEHDIHGSSSRQTSSVLTDRSRASGTTVVGSEAGSSQHTSYSSTNTLQPNPPPPRPQRQDSQDNLKSFKVSLDDPAWKVLPAALKKYKINNDDWQNYAMFICYGAPGSRIERCLSYDEKPLLLFQKLKDAKKNPVFMLKHIKDIRSPIAVAQQKQAARKASATDGGSAKSTPTPGASGHAQSHGQHLGQSPSQDGRGRPPKLQVNSHLPNQAPGIMTAVPNGQSGWPELMSPMVEHKVDFGADASKAQGDAAGAPEASESGTPPILREMPPASEVSYAVAIYPYMAEQEDEFDVIVGDTFIIVSRARGWWVVQRDPAGTGYVDQDPSKQGWVPAGCLLETKVPVAAAIAEATARGGMVGTPPSSPPGTTPILPLSILSTSFPGIALMDYKKKGEEELDLQKDDSLRVFKRYNHWSYAVKEESGDRGWVPSWFIGKVPSSSGTPATPSVANAPNLSVNDQDSRYGDLSATQQAQVSPMSSAFPPIQSRTAAVV